jgi:hypothetical protein
MSRIITTASTYYGGADYTNLMEVGSDYFSLYAFARCRQKTSIRYTIRSFSDFHAGDGFRQMFKLSFHGRTNLQVST